MLSRLRRDAETIVNESIREVQPDKAVVRALEENPLGGRIRLVAVGKAAWQMAKAAAGFLGDKLERGIVVTKYGHVQGEISGV